MYVYVYVYVYVFVFVYGCVFINLKSSMITGIS